MQFIDKVLLFFFFKSVPFLTNAFAADHISSRMLSIPHNFVLTVPYVEITFGQDHISYYMSSNCITVFHIGHPFHSHNFFEQFFSLN